MHEPSLVDSLGLFGDGGRNREIGNSDCLQSGQSSRYTCIQPRIALGVWHSTSFKSGAKLAECCAVLTALVYSANE